jgi:broad specificity phosphatase PhoE
VAVTIALVRHGAHIHLDRIFSGRMPGIPLSDAGRAQVDAVAARLAGSGITRVQASPLDRTLETAGRIAAAAGVAEPEAVPGLIEIDMGAWTGRAFGSLDGDPAWRAWNERRGAARVPGGETMAEAQARIVAQIDRLVRDHDGERVVLVSHSDMIRAAVAHVLGLPLDHVLRFDIDPASVSWMVAGDWGARLLTLNERFY